MLPYHGQLPAFSIQFVLVLVFRIAETPGTLQD